MVTRTDKRTVRGKPVFLDEETGEEYSEKTRTIPYGDGYVVIPSVIDNGMEMSEDELYEYVQENGPYDFMTGEKLPVHADLEEADRYAQWRSDNQYNEDIFDENYWHRDAAMPYYADPSASYDEDAPTLEEYRPTLRDNARNNIREGLMDYGLPEDVARNIAVGLAGEENPTDDGLGMGLMDLTPAGILMGGQEARRDFNRAAANDDLVGMGVAGAEGALAVAEAIPGIGVAAKGIRRGASKMIDAYDPAAVGSFGANMFAPKKVSDMDVLTKDADTDALETLGLDEEAREAWRKKYKVNQRQQRIPQIQDAAAALLNKEITSAEYRELVESFQPIVPLDKVPDLPTLEEIASALNSDKVRKGIVGVNKGIEDGTFVASRLDIPAYEQYDTWVVSLHDGAGGKLNGNSIGYAQTAVLKDVTFNSIPKAAANIASGKKDKATIARIFGNWENRDPEEVYALAQQYMDDPEWTQVGMNPFRHSYFYDKNTGEPVVGADEVIQVGPLVLARNARRASPDDAAFRINPKAEDSPTFALGGLAEARKGITTQEGEEMAKKKFQLDQKEADLDGDGQLSEYEEARGEAIQKAMADSPEQDEKYGMNCGGMMEPMGYDEVSGNPIPIGSTPENVRDDIEIRISEGEYVLPADVVKWHGLKHIMDMQDEAKMGLMGMAMEGLIQYVDEDPEATTECPNCMGKGCEYCEGEAGEEVEDAEVVSEDDTDVPSEEVDVEYPAVEVEDELAEAGTEEEYPVEAPLPGMMKKQKYAFIIS